MFETYDHPDILNICQIFGIHSSLHSMPNQDKSQTQKKARDYELLKIDSERGYAKISIVVRERTARSGYTYLYIRLPSAVVDALGIKPGDVITIEIHTGKR